MTDRTFDPLDRQTYEALIYNGIGRASEIEGYPAYALSHSTGNSGWSVGAVQWDFGQPGRGHKVPELLAGYQAWAPANERFSDAQLTSLTQRLRTPGQAGNALSDVEQSRLGSYLRSDPGRQFVEGLNQQQISLKWDNVAVPLSEIPWLQRLRQANASEATEIVAMTSKLYNQNPSRAEKLIEHLRTHESTSAQTAGWIGNEGIDGLKPAARSAIVGGRDKALAGARLFSTLELSEGRVGDAWREQVHTLGNPGLSGGFSSNPNVQLLDGMMRNPGAGAAILRHVDGGHPAQATDISGATTAARLEMAHVRQDRSGRLRVDSPSGDQFEMTPEGWNRNGEPMQRAPARQNDMPDFMSPGSPGIRPISTTGAGPSLGHQGTGDRERADSTMGHALPSTFDSLHADSVAAVTRLDASLGRRFDQASEKMSCSLTRLAAEHGFTRIDHAVLSVKGEQVAAGENVFIVQGKLDDAANRVAHMKTQDAVATPVQQSISHLQGLEAARAMEQVPQPVHSLAQNGAAGPAMRMA